ncbi:MAG: hypothetical protein JWR37_292 [Mycobacterium sp.]|nr:hypothetical protein [Mycobacterium sp.]
MKTAVHSAGPADDTRHQHGEALSALREAVARSAKLWRDIDDSELRVPGLSWTVAETAAHVVGDMRDYAEALSRHARGYLTHADRRPDSPSRLSTVVNARHLTVVPERNFRRLADMLEETADGYLSMAAGTDVGATIPTPNGLVLSPATMSSLLLGEQLLHGLDIARAAGVSWRIDRADALLVIPGILTVAPEYLHPARSANLRVSFELRMRGGPHYRMAVEDGSAVITAAGDKADCTITADPVAFLLVGYGRSSQWSQLIRGRVLARGRKPWFAAKLGTLLTSP